MATLPSSSAEFTAMSYNMLQPSLGSNCIPWVLTIEPDVLERVKDATGVTWTDLHKALTKQYIAHWHKNLNFNPFIPLRLLWSGRLESQEDISSELEGVTFVRSNTISYEDRRSTPEAPVLTEATNMHGTLISLLGEEVGDMLFAEVMRTERTVYDWNIRGARVMRRITEAYDTVGAPDVVALQEYEDHDRLVPFREGHPDETFPQAMSALGFNGAFFHGPDHDRVPPAGLTIYWRRDVFHLTADDKDGCIDLRCRDIHEGLPAYSLDLRERRTLVSAPTEQIEMPDAKRKNAGLIRLVHSATGVPVWFSALHAMTRSLDKSPPGRWAGEMRIRELAQLRTEVAKHVPAGDALVVMGDFNTPVSNVSILSGRVLDAEGSAYEEHTGFDTETSCLDWAPSDPDSGTPRHMPEVFSSLHKWADPATSGYCTSLNSERKEWIDLMFYSSDQLEVIARSEAALRIPETLLPNEVEPSDHLAIAARFHVRGGKPVTAP